MARMSPDALALWQRWLRFHRITLDRLDADLVAERGLTLEQYDVLYQLSLTGEPVRMGHVAAATLIAPSSCTRIVGALVATGLVERREDPDDRRAVLVGLTAVGRRAQRRAASVHLRGITELFADRLDDPARRALAEVLDRLERPSS
jgi:DNA-binding MarR family transcriptional regulator